MALNLTADPAMRIAKGDTSRPVIRILVIEDDDMDQEVLHDHMRTAKIRDHILFVSDSHKARELLLRSDEHEIRSKLCAVFLDLRLPGISGVEILRLIRTTPEISNLPVIIMSGLSDPKALEECKELKATSYLPKPMGFQSFCMAVANVFHLPNPPPMGLAEG